MTNDMLTVLNDIPFSIPPYFALLARAIVTLEGLALSADPDYGLVIEAYPFVARKLLSSDRPELQQALQEVLYAGSGTSLGGVGVVTPTRLASLLNSAAGIVAKKEGQAFVDLDAVPEDGVTPSEALKYILSDQAASLRALLATEAETAADLLVRQALRKSVPLLAAAIPQPPTLPFLPKPPEPLELPLPLLVPEGGVRTLNIDGSSSAATIATAVASTASTSRPVLTTGQALLEALAPPLSREEEIYAISLIDLLRNTLGEEAASLINGELTTDPVGAAKAALPYLELLEKNANGPADAGSSPVLDLAARAARVVASLPSNGLAGLPALLSGGAVAEETAASTTTTTHAAAADGEALDLSKAVSELSEGERAIFDALLGELSGQLVGKLDERLMAVE